VGGFVGHVSLILIFLVWAGRDAFGSFELPDVHWFVIGGAVAVALLLLGLLIPWSRRFIVGRLVPILRRALDGAVDVIHSPSKVVLLIGGSTMVTLSYLCALYFATQAFGGGLPLATVGAVFLVGSAVAQAAPTPGGLGAMEAALIGGLAAAGMDHTIAVPAVFLYRLATYWLPILPGWLCFTWLERREYL
jgi:undecaprenyl-diphosphatase